MYVWVKIGTVTKEATTITHFTPPSLCLPIIGAPKSLILLPFRISKASSFERVMLSCFQEDGRRDLQCFTRMCDACTCKRSRMKIVTPVIQLQAYINLKNAAKKIPPNNLTMPLFLFFFYTTSYAKESSSPASQLHFFFFFFPRPEPRQSCSY